MARAGAVFIDVLPRMAGWNTAVRAQAGVSLAGAGTEAGKSFTGGLMRSLKMGLGGMKAEVGAQSRAAAEAAASAVVSAEAKMSAARKREADSIGAVKLATEKLTAAQRAAAGVPTEKQAIALTGAEERLASAERRAAAGADVAAAAARRLSGAQETAAAATTAAGAESSVASRRFGTIGAGADKVAGKVGKFGKAIGGMVGLFGAFEVAKFGVESFKAATEFQKSTSVLVTAAGETKSNLALIRKGIVDISDETGTTTEDLSKGMYTVEKAGFRGAAGLKILSASAKGAKEENADLGTVTNAMTSIMNSYGIKAGKSVNVMNELKTAAAGSKTTMENFAGSLSTVLPIAAANKISFADVAGAIGTLTSHGTSAQEATQELAFSIRSLSAPNAVAVKEMGQFGIKSQDVATHLGKKGLRGTIEGLSTAVLTKMGPSGKVLLDTFYKSSSAAQSAKQMYDKLTPAQKKLADAFKSGSMSYKDWTKKAKGLAPEQYNQISQWGTLQKKATGFNDAIKQGLPGSQTYSEAMKKMMGGSTGLNTALMLTGTSADATKKRTDAITKSYKDNATEVEGWKATQKTAAVAQDRMKNSIKNAGMVMASAFLPTLTKITTGVANFVTGLMKFSQAHKWVGTVAKIVLAIGAAFVVLSLGVWAVNAALDSSPITWIILGLAALVVGIVLAYQHVKWFHHAVVVAWDAIKKATKATVDWFKTYAWPVISKVFQKISDAAMWLWTKAIKPAVDFIMKHWKLLLGILAIPMISFLGPAIAAFFLVKKYGKTMVDALITGFKFLVSAGKALWHGLEVAWSGIRTGISAIGNAANWLYKNAIKPSFDFIVAAGKFLWGYVLGPIFALWLAAWKGIGNGAIWLWNHAISPMFGKIGDFAKWLWNSAVKPAFDSFVAGLKAIGHWATWLYDNAIHPAFVKVSDFAKWLWNNGVKPSFNFFVAGLKAIGSWATWLYDNAIHPAFTKVSDFAKWLWNHGVKPSFDFFVAGLKAIASWANWLYDHGIKPAWDSIGSAIHSVYHATIEPVFKVFTSVLKDLKKTFHDVVHGIGDIWSGLTSIVSKPINAVIGFIDDPLISGFNKIMASVPGVKLRLPSIPKIGGGGSSAPVGHGGGHVPGTHGSGGMARGGILPGMSRAHQGDDQLVPMRRGEGVYVSEAMRDPFERARLHAVNAAALSGKPLSNYQGQQGYSIGGIIGTVGGAIGNAAKGVWSAAKTAADILTHPGAAVSKLLNHLLGGIGNSWPAQLFAGGFKSIAGTLGKVIAGMFGGGASGGKAPANVSGAKATGKAMAAAMGWSGGNWDALYNLWMGESGWNANAYNPNGGATGIPQSLPGSKMASAGADWRTNPRTQIKWGLGYIRSVYGSPSAAYGKWLARNPHWYARGTNSAAPGMAIVGENGPEAVMFAGGERVLNANQTAGLRGPGRGGMEVHHEAPIYIDHVVSADVDDFERQMSARKRISALAGRRS